MMKRLLLLLCLASAAWADPFAAAGRWRIYHTDGSPIIMTLYPNHSARSNWENGTKGYWKWVNGNLVVRWKDGWRDVIGLKEGRFEKLGYAPDNRDLAAPSNRTAAYQLDAKP